MSTDSDDFVISRSFDAPRSLLWKAWTERERLSRWSGAKGSEMTVLEMEVRPGGRLHARYESPVGGPIWGLYRYREIVPEERLVWEHSFADAEGNVVRPPFSGLWPLTLLSTVEFDDSNGGTKITVTWSPLDASEEERQAFREGMVSMRNGWRGSFEELDAYLAEARD